MIVLNPEFDSLIDWPAVFLVIAVIGLIIAVFWDDWRLRRRHR